MFYSCQPLWRLNINNKGNEQESESKREREEMMGFTVRAPRPVSFGPPLYLQLRRFPSKHIGIRSLLFRYGGQNILPRSLNMKFSSCVSAAKATSSSITAAATGAAAGGEDTTTSLEVEELREIKDKCRQWKWKGRYAINYFVSLSDPPPSSSNPKPKPSLLLVHGFGASIPHWRRNIRTLSQNYSVYAIDLLGFGASEKPTGFSYTMEKWAKLILDFLDEIVQKPTVLIGNSVGSLACVIAASESNNKALVGGLVLLNCAGGMNNKAIVDDWRIKLLLPLLWFFDFLLKQRRIASAIFERVKQRDTIRKALLAVYGNKESVDKELVEIIMEPTCDPGALDAFVSIVTGPPGPNPMQLISRISDIPLLVLWGDQDPFTPLDGPLGKYFASLPSQLPPNANANVSFFVLPGVGHCPHDDRPELVHERLLPWLDHLSI